MRPPPAGAELPPGAHSLAQDDGYVQSGFRVASDRNARVAGRRVEACLSAEAPAPEGAAPLLANRRGRLDALLLVHRERDFRAARVLAPVLPPGDHEPLQLLPLLRRELGLGLLVRADGGKPAVRAKSLDLPHLGFHPAHVHRIALA